MKRSDLIGAEKAHARLKRAEEYLEAFKGKDLVGVIVGDKGARAISSNIMLRKDTTGTGSVNSFGYPDEFAAYMTGCMQKYFQADVEIAREELRKFGVEL